MVPRVGGGEELSQVGRKLRALTLTAHNDTAPMQWGEDEVAS
jgi:hypothetical protein